MIFRYLLLMILGICLFLFVLSLDAMALQKGESLPALTAKTLTGEPYDFTQLRGKPILLKVGATWCPHCLEEALEIDKIKQWMADQHIQYIEVFLLETAQQVNLYLEEHNIKPDVVLLGSEEIGKALQVRSVPLLLLIDSEFKIHRVVVGALSATSLRQALTEML